MNEWVAFKLTREEMQMNEVFRRNTGHVVFVLLDFRYSSQCRLCSSTRHTMSLACTGYGLCKTNLSELTYQNSNTHFVSHFLL